MKKKITLLALVLCCVLVLAGCGCEHEWVEADCVTPKTCSLCEETEGEALGHTWEDADCLNPKTCAECGETEGEALGHTWIDATCAAPKTCEVCGETEGEALEHTWIDATTEAPKTCEVCGETEGERIITDERFTTAEAAALFGSWAGEITISGELMGIEGFDDDVAYLATFTFENDGSYSMHLDLADETAFIASMQTYMEDLMYSQLAEVGYDAEAADAAMVATYGMSVSEYVAYALAEMDFDALLEEATYNGVYYVEGTTLYGADSWDSTFGADTFALEGDVLSVSTELLGESVDLQLTKVAE